MFFCASITSNTFTFFQQRKRIEKKIFVKQRYIWLGFQQYWRLWCRGCHKKKPSNWTRIENQIWEIKHKQKQSANNRFSTHNLYSFRWVFFSSSCREGLQTHSHRSRLPLKSILIQLAQAASRGSGYMPCIPRPSCVLTCYAVSYPIHAPLPLFYMHTRTHITSRHR